MAGSSPRWLWTVTGSFDRADTRTIGDTVAGRGTNRAHSVSNAGDLEARLQLARVLITRHQYAPACDHLLEIVRRDRKFNDDAARKTLFGAWEGNWLAYNFAHDVELPGASGPKLGFLMYPQAEVANARLDCLDPDNFRYTITAKEITSA